MTKILKHKDRKRKEARARARWKGRMRSWHELSVEERQQFAAFLATQQEPQTTDNGDGTFTHTFAPRHLLEGEPNFSRTAAEVHQKMFEEKINGLQKAIREELREATRPHGSAASDRVAENSQAE